MTISDPLQRVRGGLVVSCQAYPGEPMRHPMIMAAVAEAALAGGAVGIRAEGLEDLALIRARTSAPLIGLLKIAGAPVSMTPDGGTPHAVSATAATAVSPDSSAAVREPLTGCPRRPRCRRGAAGVRP